MPAETADHATTRQIREHVLSEFKQHLDHANFKQLEQVLLAQERRFSQKRFQLPAGYGDYQALMHAAVGSTYLTAMFLTINEGRDLPAMAKGQVHLGSTFKSWVNVRQPMVAVGPELASALVESKPPNDLRWSDLRWPFSTWCVAVPPGFMTMPTGAPLTFILVTAIDASERSIDLPVSEHHQQMLDTGLWEDGRGRNMLEVVLVSPMEVYWRSVRPLPDQQIDEIVKDPAVDLTSNTTLSEDQLIYRAMYFIVSLSMYMAAEPNDRLNGEQLRTMKPAKELRGLLPKLGPDQLWTANIVGRQYAEGLSAEEQAAYDHRSPRAHWRRGHWRAQAYGERLALRRPTWIRPTLVGT